MSRRFAAPLAAALLLLTPGLAAAQHTEAAGAEAAAADPLQVAIDAGDAPGLAALAAVETGDRAALARGALAALRREDALALERLAAAAQSPALSPDLRRTALITRSNVLLRQSRFAEAQGEIETARAVPGQTGADAFREDTETNLVFTRTLRAAPPMQATVAASGQVAIERDMARLPRADVTINGRRQEAVLDTGAGFSTITQSVAEQLGLRMLEGEVTVGSSTGPVAAHLAIADTLAIAGGVYANVVFIVLPDSALSFAGGLYRIPAIVGLPVLMQLGRVEFSTAGGEMLRHSSAPFALHADANLELQGVQPLVLVHAEGADIPLRMVLDSGARSTNFARRVAAEAPGLMQGATRRARTIGGAGGEVRDEEAMEIPRVTLSVGARSVTLEDVGVHGDPANERHGTLGQDVLARGYVLDFNTMRFELAP